MLGFGYMPRQEKSMKNRVFLVMLLSIAALSAGCNTVAGAGKDIQRGGEKIEGAAEKK
ncbi:entericidin B membrane lipoprotein [compost metagenome]